MPDLTLEALADRLAAVERQVAALTAARASAAGDSMTANPLYSDYSRAVEEYRREQNAVPDAREDETPPGVPGPAEWAAGAAAARHLQNSTYDWDAWRELRDAQLEPPDAARP